MKKPFAILFALVYMFLITGITIEVHYCMGEVQSVSLYGDGHACCCESDATPLGCCSDEQIVVQFAADEQLAKTTVYTTKFPARVVEIIEGVVCDQPYDHRSEPGADAPSKKPNLPFWLKHCSLTYYG